MTPSPRVNDLIGGVLGRSLALHDVELFAFVFVSNHFHLIVRAKAGELSKFMQHLQGNIAREIGKHVDWSGKFWHRRYSSEAILDDEAFTNRLAYIFAHGVKEGLVDRSADWPGLTCLPELTRGQRRLFSWVDRTLIYTLHQKDRRCTEQQATQRYPIELSCPPAWRRLSSGQRCKRAKSVMLDSERESIRQRGDKPGLGAQRVSAQHPFDRPQRVARSPRPLCHGGTRASRNAYKQTYRDFVCAYRQASQLFRAGAMDTTFPRYSYRPPPSYGLDD